MIAIRNQLLVSCILVSLSCFSTIQANAQGNDLIKAAYEGDLPRINTLLAAKSDVNASNSNGATAIMAASQSGHLNVVQLLLSKGANVNSRMNNGVTALIIASQNGHLKVVQALLVAGASGLLDWPGDTTLRN